MLTRHAIALAALAGLCAFTAAAPAPQYRPSKASAELLKRLQGLWEAGPTYRTERLVLGGRAAPVQGLSAARSATLIRVEGDQWTHVRVVNGEHRALNKYTIKLDPSKKPMWIDLVREGTNTTYRQGVIEVEGESARFSYTTLPPGSARSGDRGRRPPRVRPTGFEADEDSPQMTMTLRRVGAP
ncbi:MAG: hypothetical protein U0797_04355 [Gemmataceae bacterium]